MIDSHTLMPSASPEVIAAIKESFGLRSKTKQMIYLAIENGHVDDTFKYYKKYIDSRAQFPETQLDWNNVINELKNIIYDTGASTRS